MILKIGMHIGKLKKLVGVLFMISKDSVKSNLNDEYHLDFIDL